MKNFLPLKFCALAAICLAALWTRAEVTHTCSFSLSGWSSQVEYVQGNLLTTYGYTGLHPTPALSPGLPLLPSQRVTLAVPYNATAFTVTVTDSTATDTIETFTVKPVPVPKTKDGSVDEEPLVFDKSVYGTDALFPASPVMLGGEGYYMGEHHLLTLEVYPMRYNPVTRQLRRYTSLSFTVSWTTSAAQAAHAIIRSSNKARTRSRAEAQAMVANPGQLAAFVPPIEQVTRLNRGGPVEPIDSEDPFFGGEMYTDVMNYTIITTDSLRHALRKIVALKRQKGYSVTVKTVAEIEADSTVAGGDCVALNDTCSYIPDTSGKMRQWLRNAFRDSNTEYVFMAGKDVPFRYECKDTMGIVDIPTDWYFCDLTTNWNINDNTKYGEYSLYIKKDSPYKFDMEPELYVGRIMFENPVDVGNYTQKLLRYELNPGNGSTNYLGRAIAAVDTILNDSIFENPISVVFEHTDSLLIGKTFPTAKSLVDSINAKKYGFISIDGHGLPNAVLTRRNNSIYTYADLCKKDSDSSLDQIENGLYPGVMYASACATTPFDDWSTYTETFPYQLITYTGRNMGQSFTLEKNYGGSGYIGYTRECNIIPAAEILQKFVAELNSCRYNIGKTEAFSKMSYNRQIDEDVLKNNLIGDPEFELWTHSLTPFSGITVSRGNHWVTVSGIDASGDVATVSICNNTNQMQLKTSESSVSFAQFDPNSLVMVRAHGKLPYIAPFVLQNTSINKSQYVIANEVVAGDHVDSGRAAGNVKISSGVNYEIEYKGSVTLEPGFSVENGATFSATPSEY